MLPHQEEKIYLNALNIIFANNFLKLFSLLSSGKSIKEIWDNLNPTQKRNINPLKEWQKLKENNINFIQNHSKDYPKLLKEISSPPFALYVKGQIPQNSLYIAVVGTRKISGYGKLVTEKLVEELTRYNFVIVSGLAYGIDTIAHKTALKNNGKTIAVLGSGLNNIFPCYNRKLSEQIIRNGALITEYALNTPALKSYFPWRNRIISGLCLGTLVIEAPEKSGALITAKFALEQNREVFAVPGSIFDKNSAGPHYLIEKGAKLVSQIEDILEELNIPSNQPKKNNAPQKKFDSKKEELIYQILSEKNPLSIDKIIKSSNLCPKEVLALLTTLELKNYIKDTGGGNYIKDK